MSATMALPPPAAPPPGAIGAIGAPPNGGGISPAVQVARQFMPWNYAHDFMVIARLPRLLNRIGTYSTFESSDA